MKKFFMLALAVLAFASCAKEDNKSGEAQNTHVVLNIAKEGVTRGLGKTVAKAYVNATSGNIYFADAAGVITDVFTIVDANPDADARELVLASGANTFTNVSGKSAYVYIVANTGLAAASVSANISTVTGAVLGLANQTDDVSASTVANMALYGKSSVLNHQVSPSTATVTLAPIGSRIEIHKFDVAPLDAVPTPSEITKYRIEGIYMNYYYAKATVAGVMTSAADNDLIKYEAETNAKDPKVFVSGAGAYTTDGVNYNENTSGLGFLDTTTTMEYRANESDNTVIWAYNMFAPSNGTTFPHIVIRVGDLELANAAVGELRWMTVTQFLNVSDNSVITTFEPGKIYKIENFLFNENNLDVAPEMASVTAQVSVVLAQWEPVGVKPW